MRSLVQGPKNVVWWLLARLLSGGAALIRRRPGPVTPEEWRAVQVSYAHFGEDLVVLSLLRDLVDAPRKGVYVDVGAFDPAFFSNTLLLRQHGWSGMNIDANPDRIALVQRRRPDDINICAAISNNIRPRVGTRSSRRQRPPPAMRAARNRCRSNG
jgi:hypothetical protein